jgi:16S rRNA processing protein RimM
MDKQDFYFLGKITKTSGYKGNLVFFFDVDDIDRYIDLKAVFIELNAELIPFAINSIVFKSGKTAMVQLEDIHDEESGAALIGSDVYLPLSYLPELKGNQFYFHEVIGFSVIDKKLGNLGKIKEIMDQSSQALLIIDHKGKEILIPITDEIITRVDRTQEIIYVNTPEGLIDIYL